MILKRRRIFFRIILLTLEDDMMSDVIKNGGYSKISITSYNKMNLLDFKELVKTTALIDLTAYKDDIFGRFSDTTRNEIRKTYRNNDLTIVGNDENFCKAYELYKKFEYSQGRVPVARNVLRGCKLFSAYFKKELVSAIFITESPKYIRIRSIFSKRLLADDKALYKAISNATRRLVWEICLWGKDTGYDSLDMASVNFNNPKTANITKFKMSFGGKVANEYTYVYKSKVFLFFEKFVIFKILIVKLWQRIKNLINFKQ